MSNKYSIKLIEMLQAKCRAMWEWMYSLFISKYEWIRGFK